jgi:malic enzyme
MSKANTDRPSPLDGAAMLDDPVLNKGTAFTSDERRTHKLEGLLPPTVETLDRQLERVLGHLNAKPNDLERYIYLVGLADRNETLFYKTLMSDPARFVPIVYDPTVADACLAFGHIYRRTRGKYLTKHMKGRLAEVLRNWPIQDVRFICIFPAIALAVYATRPKRITDQMFITAAKATADQVGPDDRKRGMLFPPQASILETEITTATRVAEFIFNENQATIERPPDIRNWIESIAYKPQY